MTCLIATHQNHKKEKEIGEKHSKPLELKEFMKCWDLARVKLPSDPAEYGRRWTAWWRSLQPSWRVPANPKEPLRDENSLPNSPDWSTLSVGGRNGIVLAIIGIAIWSMSADRNSRSRMGGGNGIVAAIKDVDLVLQMMLANWKASQ